MGLKQLVETDDVFGSGKRDVQTTTFSVDGVARFACNTWEELHEVRGTRGFDVVIVGSGMYGAYLSAKLHEFRQALGPAAAQIAVLESGPFLVSEHIQNLTRTGDFGSLVFEPLSGPSSQSQVEEPPNCLSAGNLVDHAKCVGGKSLFSGGCTLCDMAVAWSKALRRFIERATEIAEFSRLVFVRIARLLSRRAGCSSLRLFNLTTSILHLNL